MNYPRSIISRIEPYLQSPEAVIITGMRRTGKTTILRMLSDRIGNRNQLFIDLENPLNRRMFEEDNYDRIFSGLGNMGADLSRRVFLFIDEIQFAPGLPSVMKYLIDHRNVKFFVTGSASFYTKNLFSESMSGRKEIFELFPLTFVEFLGFRGEKAPAGTTDTLESDRDRMKALYEEYMTFGGFPGVVLKEGAEAKRRAIEEVFSSFYQYEVTRLTDFRKNDLMRDLMELLLKRAGSMLDISRLSRELQVSRPTVASYVSFLEAVYMIKLIRPFAGGSDTEIRKMPKIYACDCGLLAMFGRPDEGALFENSVFQNLRAGHELNYFRKKNGLEIDFIVDRKFAVEAKRTADPSDVKRLERLSAELHLEKFTTVTLAHSELPGTAGAYEISCSLS